MSTTLSTSVLELGFTSEREIEEALARQVMYGGDLASNLVELGILSEQQVLTAAARSSGLEATAPGELPQAPDELGSVVAIETQRRYGVHVLGEEDGQLLIAVSDKLAPQLEEELAAMAGRPLRQLVSTWARVEQALARSLAQEPSERAQNLLRRLDGRASVAPIAPGLPVDFKQLPRPESMPPIEFTAAALDFEVSTAPPPEGYVEFAQSQASAPHIDASPHYVRASPGPPPATRRRGPYTAAMAERDLLEATDRHAVLTAFFDFAAQYFEYAALFVLKGGEAVGYRARGSGTASDRLRGVRIPLDLPSAFARARDEGNWVLTRFRAGGIEGGVVRDLARSAGKKVLVLPLLVKGRTVLFLYGDHGGSDVDLTSIGDILSFAPLASAALERAILRKKGYARLPPLAALRPRPGHTTPTRDQKTQALAQLVAVEPPRRATEPPGASNDADPSAHRPLPSEARSWRDRRASSVPPFPSRQQHTLPGVAAPANPPADRGAPEEAPSAILARPTVSLGPEPGEAPPPPSLPPDSAEPPEDGWDIDASFEDHEHGTVAGVGPRAPKKSSRPTARFSLAPPPAQLDFVALVERLCSGDDAALDEVLSGGDLAVAALVARFPGPLPKVQSREAIGKASECGPVLSALVRMGSRAIPYLTVRTADEDAHVREWATRLLGELPSRESAQAVARRTVDDIVEVRRAALASARMTQQVPEAREGTRGQLEELARDAVLSAQVRRAAVEALTDLREPLAVPCMIELLGDEDREVSGAARWSLVVLARQDFGADQDYWSRFWQANQTRHRIEWLIDSLTHESRDIRRAAGDELKSVSKEYFGYYDDLPEVERQRVQARYREWWTESGRARFS